MGEESAEVLDILNSRRAGGGSTAADERVLISRARRRHRESESSDSCAECHSDIGASSGVLPDGRKLCSDCLSDRLDKYVWLKAESSEFDEGREKEGPRRIERSPRKKRKNDGVMSAMIASSLVVFLVIGFPFLRQRHLLSLS